MNAFTASFYTVVTVVVYKKNIYIYKTAFFNMYLMQALSLFLNSRVQPTVYLQLHLHFLRINYKTFINTITWSRSDSKEN